MVCHTGLLTACEQDQDPILKYPRPTFLPQCERPSFAPIQNNRQNYILYYYGRSHWPRGLSRGSTAGRLQGLWVRIPTGGMDVCLCCQVEVSASCWSLAQRTPTDCDALLCAIKKPHKWGGHGPRWAAAPQEKIYIILILHKPPTQHTACSSNYDLRVYIFILYFINILMLINDKTSFKCFFKGHRVLLIVK